MDKKIYQGTTFTRNTKNFKENVWKAKKSGFVFQIFRKSLAWRVEAQNSKSGESFSYQELGFQNLEKAFEFVVNFKNNE